MIWKEDVKPAPKKKEEKREPIASMGLSNTFAMCIYDVDNTGDWVVAGLCGDKPRRRKLYSSVKRGSYFKYRHSNYYLDNFIRTNYPEVTKP